MILKHLGQKYSRLLLSISLFLVAFLPRAVYSVSPNLNWYGRSIRFWDAILSQNWVDTFQRYHPGVTTMWLSGLGLRIFSWVRGFSSEELLAFDQLPAGILHQAVNAGLLPLAIVISLGIVLIFYLLAQLTDKKIALAAAFFMALNPLYITYSKDLHLDAVMAILMVTTILLMLLYRKRKANWILVVAGILTAFSLLTKSPATLLIPIGALLIANSHKLVLPKDGRNRQLEARAKWLWVVSQKVLIWMLSITITYIVFWPAMWVAPFEALYLIYEQVLFHVVTPHPNLSYFNGKITDDPGILYYGAVLMWRTTLITFPLFLIGVGKLFSELIRKRVIENSTILFVLVFGIMFFVQMELSAKKAERYILPVFLSLDVIAAYGLIHLGYFLKMRLKVRNSNAFWTLLIAGFLLFQAGMVLPKHPYYGNNYNYLLGGIHTAEYVLGLQPQAEGVDLAGKYLDTLPEAAENKVAIFSFVTEMFFQHYNGTVSINDEEPSLDAEYRIYYTSQIERGLGGPGWMDAWESDRLREPEYIVEFNDIPFVWIYKTPNESK